MRTSLRAPILAVALVVGLLGLFSPVTLLAHARMADPDATVRQAAW